MLLDCHRSLLLLIDVQENNINSIHQHEQLVANCRDLVKVAKAFNVPVLASEHVPEKTGPIVAELQHLIEADSRFSKQEFSAQAAGVMRIQSSNRQQIIVAGVETHICVMQTALELLDDKYQVYVVADATDSCFPEDRGLALQRMQQCGIQLLSKQMVLFEWARYANNPIYQGLSSQMLK